MTKKVESAEQKYEDEKKEKVGIQCTSHSAHA